MALVFFGMWLIFAVLIGLFLLCGGILIFDNILTIIIFIGFVVTVIFWGFYLCDRKIDELKAQVEILEKKVEKMQQEEEEAAL